MAQLVKEFASGVYNLVLGLFTTGKHLGRHAITVQYPKERWTMPERSRGMVVLLSDKETGELNCNACLLCMRGCPSGAIDIDYYKDEKNKRHLKGFKVDYNICCFCGLCEEACNFSAIKLATKYEFPEFDRDRLIWDTARLQEMGRDVPYEDTRKKKAEERRAAVREKAASTSEDTGTPEERTAPIDRGGSRAATKETTESPEEAKTVESHSENRITGDRPESQQDGDESTVGGDKDEEK